MTKSDPVRVGVHEAKTHLSRLLERVESGEEILITKRGEVVARLVGPTRRGRRRLGADSGTFSVPVDFDDPLPEDVLAAFER